MRNLLSFFIFILLCISAQSQTRQLINQQLYWMRYNNQISLSKKWNWQNELEERRFFINNRHQQFIAHSRIHYKISENSDVGVGFTYSLQDPQDPKATTILTVPELRPVQEINYSHPINERISLSQRFRIDERFIHKNNGVILLDGYDFNFRFRYRLQASYRFNKDIKRKSSTLKISDEIMVNAGKNILYNRFDQNRIYLGLEKSLNKNFSAELGYIYWFQQRSNGFQYYDRDIIRLSLYQKIRI